MTNADAPPPSAAAAPVSEPPATNGLAITGFSLIGIDSDQPLPGYANVSGTIEVDLSETPAFTVIAHFSGDVGSVHLETTGRSKVENAAPYSLTGDHGGDYRSAWSPSVGWHTVTATPYSRRSLGGDTGSAGQLVISVVP